MRFALLCAAALMVWGQVGAAEVKAANANPFDRQLAKTFEAREKDWRNGAIVYQVLPDRFAPSTRLEEKKSLYPAPKVLRRWDELPTRGTYLEGARLWSHEIDFWGGDLQSQAGKLDYVQQLGADVVYLNPVHLVANSKLMNTFAMVDRLGSGTSLKMQSALLQITLPAGGYIVLTPELSPGGVQRLQTSPVNKCLGFLLVVCADIARAQSSVPYQAPPPGARDFYLRGSVNQWAAADAQKFSLVCNRFEWVTTLQGEHSLKWATTPGGLLQNLGGVLRQSISLSV